jgi:hypothetical protein
MRTHPTVFTFLIGKVRFLRLAPSTALGVIGGGIGVGGGGGLRGRLVCLHFNSFTAEVAIMRLLDSAPKSHLCDQKRRSIVTGLSNLMTLFIDLRCLYCKQKQRAFNVFKNTLNWLKIDSVDQKFNWLECGNFSQDAGTSGTERVVACSQLAVKGLSETLIKWIH